ncbi:unnamed protein product [Blumeria hordei]|uniref:Delta(24)-sterol reductase n=1 Tax=Blumeria hordei TaxID=2867405 RepID=A0A383UPS5_BLUHO|nr:unnamed protein product [Blumeria hordei]
MKSSILAKYSGQLLVRFDGSYSAAFLRNGRALSTLPTRHHGLACKSLREMSMRSSTIRPAHRYFSTTHSRQGKAPIVTSQHNERVEKISTVIREFYERKEKWRINHGSTNSTRPLDSKKNLVHTTDLSNILEIDMEKRTCLAEPNVPMDRLVEATLGCGLVPLVVPEFPGITVGGSYSGTCGESSSFKHGFFDKSVSSVEMVLATGDVTMLSPDQNSDLFYGAAGALGTFGVTTLVELRLQPAKRFVKTTYYPVGSIREAIETIQKFCLDSSLEYIDGIMFDPKSGVIVTGRLTDSADASSSVVRFGRRSDPWFYLHAQENGRRGGVHVEYTPLADYLFRYDRGGFWVGTAAFEYFKVPFNRFTRWALDDFLHTRMMYTALHASGQSKRFVVQDLALPYETAEEFISYTQHELGIWPLWLCPLQATSMPTMHPHSLLQVANPEANPSNSLLNIGLWGWGPKDADEYVRKNRELEKKLKGLGGMKWLYAQTYYDEREFWQQFDRPWYEALRSAYKATTLPNVYDKVKRDESSPDKVAAARAWEKTSIFRRLMGQWPFAGLYGIKKAIESRSYLAARKSEWKR